MRQLGYKDFPPLLREIPDCPTQLYLRGTMPTPEYKLLCVVGSRACSPYGRRQTQKLIAGLVGYKVAIVSGMAFGIDAEAHHAALDVGLPTVAVLPSSCDEESIYPTSNRAVAKRILSQGSALLSENKPPWKAHLHDFAARNRVMAGMCHCVLIIEASEKSGTLITARLALDYNKEVLAIPHELGRESGGGINNLLRQGATLVRHSGDILESLGLRPLESPAQKTLPADLSYAEAQILSTLVAPMERDALIVASNLSTQDANIAISSLDIRGLITERLGKVERA